MSTIIQPRVLKGFRDVLPERELWRRELQATLETVFRSFGFVPIDTPVLEYAEILLGKGGGETDKQVYHFNDRGKREVAMRFDLTVPFARFMAMNHQEVGLPFKRYHMAKAWRGENTQRGRYREFIQCDFDIVGTESPASDLEILLMISQAFEAIGVSALKVRFSNRAVFNRFINRLGISDHATDVLRAVDKLAKVGESGVRAELSDIGSDAVGSGAADEILDFIVAKPSFEETLSGMQRAAGGPGDDIDRLKQIYDGLGSLGKRERIVLDPSITRGLDYYTGTVFETFLDDLPEIGSICSGGRYDNLASLYTKTEMPGVGASIGLDRLMAALEAMGKEPDKVSSVSVVVFNLDDTLSSHYQAIAQAFRKKGISAETLFRKAKLGQQFSIAESRGAGFAVICGETEFGDGTVNLKNLDTRESFDGIQVAEAVAIVQSNLQ